MEHFLFPAYEFSLQQKEGKQLIWDISRKKWVIASPEEWVRQHVLHFLVKEKGIPLSMIAVEREIAYLKRKKRFDLVVFDAQAQPFILCECKAPSVSLTPDVAFQIATYNTVLNAPFLLITNGLSLFFLHKKEDNSYENVPFFSSH
ncbi:MAG: type I restriction enzyme HsdR N-terminal domain-containing protein [Bacteroidia bacterium]